MKPKFSGFVNPNLFYFNIFRFSFSASLNPTQDLIIHPFLGHLMTAMIYELVLNLSFG